MTTNNNNIAEPRYKLAQAEALRIWQTLGESKIPVDLNTILDCMVIQILETDLPPEIGAKSDGVTQTDKNGNCTIMYKKDVSSERKRFTIAHELGHIALEHLSFDGSSSQCSRNSQEKEANAFAGALLVPSKDLKTFMKKGDKSFKEIITRYRVSKDVASIAITDNRLLNKVCID